MFRNYEKMSSNKCDLLAIFIILFFSRCDISMDPCSYSADS